MALKSLVPWRRGNRLPAQRGVFEPFTEMERWFDDFFNSGFELRPFGESMRGFNPTVDVSESDEAYTISAELAGLDEKDVEVSLENNVLILSGEKKSEHEDKSESYYPVERSYGSFKRSFALPAEVDPDKVEASFKNGVLTVTLPKTEHGQTKRIEVKAR